MTTPDLNVVRKAARDHEIFTEITSFNDWQRCPHGKQIVEVKAHWSDDAPFTVTESPCGENPKNSTQWFMRTVHADGSKTPSFDYGVRTKCPQCGALDSLKTVQLAYHDQTICTECDYSSLYSIGD